VIERAEYQRRPTRYEYRLTEAGRDLVPVILALTAMGRPLGAAKGGQPDPVRPQDMRTSIPAAGHMRHVRRSRRVRCRDRRSRPRRAARPGTKIVAKRLRGVAEQAGRKKPRSLKARRVPRFLILAQEAIRASPPKLRIVFRPQAGGIIAAFTRASRLRAHQRPGYQ